MSNYAICSRDLTKIYSGRPAVDHVALHVPNGSIYGFVGENGSGKTTIIRLLMGLIRPNEGDYDLYDTQFKDKNIYKVREKVSAIVESPSLVPSMNAYQNLKYACMYYGINATDELINKALSDVGLHDTGKKKVKDFSLGMRQRLGIAILLLNSPTLMLLDEPMNGLDPSGVAELRDLIISLNQKGITFLISSHILSELEKVATHWGFISHGKLLKEISSEDLALECKRSLEVSYHDLNKLEEAIKRIGVKEYKRNPNMIRVYDKILPLDLLTKLNKEGLVIEHFKTIEVNVEEYYLSMIGGGAQ